MHSSGEAAVLGSLNQNRKAQSQLQQMVDTSFLTPFGRGLENHSGAFSIFFFLTADFVCPI